MKKLAIGMAFAGIAMDLMVYNHPSPSMVYWCAVACLALITGALAVHRISGWVLTFGFIGLVLNPYLLSTVIFSLQNGAVYVAQGHVIWQVFALLCVVVWAISTVNYFKRRGFQF